MPPLPLPSTGVVAAAAAMACGLGVAGITEASAKSGPVASTAVESTVVASAWTAESARAIVRPATVHVMAQPPPPTLRVAGLSDVQVDNARLIVEVGRAMGLPDRAHVIAVACAMQESSLRNLANDTVGESFRYPHEGRGSDHDSVGLFQQRSSTGWGSVRDLMRPEYAARRFYLALVKVPGWRRLSLTRAAQTVQGSAYPNAYAGHEARAQRVVDAL